MISRFVVVGVLSALSLWGTRSAFAEDVVEETEDAAVIEQGGAAAETVEETEDAAVIEQGGAAAETVEETEDAAVIEHGAPPPEADEEVEEIEEIEVVDDVAPTAAASVSFFDPKKGTVAERFLNFSTARTLRPLNLLLVFDHRAAENLADNPFRDFLGLDAGRLKIGIGVRFGIIEGLEVGISRLGGTYEIFDAYELDLKWQFLRQEAHELDAAVRAGGTWFAQTERGDALGGFAQLNLDRELFGRVLIGATALVHSDSSAARKRPDDTNLSFALGGMLEWRIIEPIALGFELHGVAAGYDAGLAWSGYAKFLTWAHSFALVVSNTQYINADGLAAGTSRGAGDVVFGFSIAREIRL